MIRGLLIIGLIIILGISIYFNAYFYFSFAPELRERRFLDSHRDEISMLLLRNAGTIEGVILDDSNGEVLLQQSTGTMEFKRDEIRKIIYNVYGNRKTKEMSATDDLTPLIGPMSN